MRKIIFGSLYALILLCTNSQAVITRQPEAKESELNMSDEEFIKKGLDSWETINLSPDASLDELEKNTKK